MANLLHHLNTLSGLFLFIICLSLASCAKSLAAIKLDLECLHEDYDKTTDAHNRAHYETMSGNGA
jgi:hypothetical protein